MRSLAARWAEFQAWLHREVWRARDLGKLSATAAFFGTLRVLAITSTVFRETKAASRAAALGVSSLLGLGPLVALTVLVAGLVVDTKDPNLAANVVSRIINFVAPQVSELSPGETQPARQSAANSAQANRTRPAAGRTVQAKSGTATANSLAIDPDLNPRLVRMVNNFIVQGHSRRAGTVGIVTLVVIVLLLFNTIEDAFNEIWGVRSGRSFLLRAFYYWVTLSLGAVIFFASLTLVGAGALLGSVNDAIHQLPFSQAAERALRWSLPLMSFALLVSLLTVLYRVLPNTRVRWRAALIGATVVAALLLLNNYLAFVYVRRVILTESLYGSLGFPLVMMSGLYVFWLCVLIGGQISYAVQNFHFRNSQAAWGHLSQTTRERLLLAVLLTICRRTQAGLPAASASELGKTIKVPTQILNESLNRLVDLKLIKTTSPEAEDEPDPSYEPARPLGQITLREFKQRDDAFGDDSSAGAFDRIDPVLLHYVAATDRQAADEFFTLNLADLLDRHPFDPRRTTAAVHRQA